MVCLHSASATNISLFDAQNFFCCMADSRIGIKDSPVNSPTKYQIVEEALVPDREVAAVSSGISADAVEGFPFDKQCSKLGDITAFICSVVIGATSTTVIMIFIAIVSMHDNEGDFQSHQSDRTLWSFAVTNTTDSSALAVPFVHLIILWAFQMLTLLLVFVWLAGNGNTLGILQNHLIFYYSQVLAGAATYSALVIVGVTLRENGFNTLF